MREQYESKMEDNVMKLVHQKLTIMPTIQRTCHLNSSHPYREIWQHSSQTPTGPKNLSWKNKVDICKVTVSLVSSSNKTKQTWRNETQKQVEKPRSTNGDKRITEKSSRRNRTTGRSRRCDSFGRIPSCQQCSMLVFSQVKIRLEQKAKQHRVNDFRCLICSIANSGHP